MLLGLTTVEGLSNLPAHAQITPDITLPINSMVPTGCSVCSITGGTLTNNQKTLFHSFQEFSVPTGGAALFQHDSSLTTIITRVTGELPSHIDGAIAAQGNADLFLLNPNGIIFGPNAVLQVPGSFIATSADSIVWSNDSIFSATDPNPPPLLTVNTPIGLYLGTTPGEIRVEGPGNFPPTRPGLSIDPGHTLAFVGGTITVNGGTLSAPAGRLDMGSATQGTVGLTPIAQGFDLEYTTVQSLGVIHLDQGALLNTSGGGGGEIDLQGQTVLVEDGSQILAITLGSGSGGDIRVTATDSFTVQGAAANGQISRVSADTYADGMGGNLVVDTQRLRVRDRALLTTSTLGSGTGGNLILRATDAIDLSGTGFDRLQRVFVDVLQGNLNPADIESGIITGSSGSGAAGQIIIDTPQLRLQAGALISTTTTSTGIGGDMIINATESVEILGSIVLTGTLQNTTQKAGDLNLDTQNLSIRDGGLLQTFTLGAGDGGDLLVNAAASIELLNTPAGAIIPTGIFANSLLGTGTGGNIDVNTQQLTLTGGGQIGNQTGAFLGTGLIPLGGPAGTILVNVNDTTQIVGLSADGRFGSGLGTSNFSGAPPGKIVLNTGNLLIQDGATITTATLSDGPGGPLIVTVDNVLELKGTGTRQPLGIPVDFPSGLISSSGRADFPGLLGTGTAGTLHVTANELIIREGATIAVDSIGQGDAGNLNATANFMRLDNGTINAATTTGVGGNIELQAPILFLENGSHINTNAGTTDGGNIVIDSLFLIAFDNSDITANAQQGRGGQVRVTAQSILGTAFREKLTSESDITATSALGYEFNGVVELNTPELGPDSGLVEVPTIINDATDKIVAGCQADRNNRFVISGHYGLPSNPTQQLHTSLGWQDWRFLDDIDPLMETVVSERNFPTTEQTTHLTIPRSQMIREASYVRMDKNGQVVLVASSDEVSRFRAQPCEG